jgi:phage anti-repressor protein
MLAFPSGNQLEQYIQHALSRNTYDTSMILGVDLIEVCGYPINQNVNRTVERQILKHDFVEGVDFKISLDVNSEAKVKPKVYSFSMRAAQHVLLAALTTRGKEARQEAINMKMSQQYNVSPNPSGGNANIDLTKTIEGAIAEGEQWILNFKNSLLND